MTSRCQQSRCFHAGGPAANDQHIAPDSGPIYSQVVFLAGLGVDDAARGDPNRNVAYAPVGVDAGSDVVATPLFKLAWKVGVSNELPAHGDEVRLALGKSPLSLVGLETAEGDYGHWDTLPHQCCVVRQ